VVGGWLLLGAAVLRLADHVVLTRWIQIASPDAPAYAFAGVTALLGVALLQGSGGARTAVLWLNTLGLLGGVALSLAGFVVPMARPLIPLGVLATVSAVALFGILTGSGSKASLSTWGVLFVLGSVGSVLAEAWLFKRVERELRETIAEWAAPEREYADESAGLRVKLPDDWVILKPGNPLVESASSKVGLGQRSVGALAVIYEDSVTPFISVDDYLDRWLADRQKRFDDLKQVTRRDVSMGLATARQMTLTWTKHGRRLEGSLSAWRDGKRHFGYLAFTTGGLSASAAPEFARLEKAIAFDAPVATHVKEMVARVTAAVPMLSPAAVAAMSRSLPKDAPPELYFRRGYQWAVKGVREIGGELPAKMGTITSKVFAALPAAQRDRLGKYLEKVQAGGTTTLQEDRAMNELMNRGLQALSEPDLSELRRLIESAVEFGRLAAT
jgi:hypothetical protein